MPSPGAIRKEKPDVQLKTRNVRYVVRYPNGMIRNNNLPMHVAMAIQAEVEAFKTLEDDDEDDSEEVCIQLPEGLDPHTYAAPDEDA